MKNTILLKSDVQNDIHKIVYLYFNLISWFNGSFVFDVVKFR